MLLLDPFGKYGIICTCACMFRSFYLSVLAAGKTSPNSTMKYWEKVWNFVKVNNEDTRGMSMFLNILILLRSFWRIQVFVNLFQHLSFHNLFHLVHCKVYDERVQANLVKSTKLWGAQCSPQLAFRSTDFVTRKPNFSSPALNLLQPFTFDSTSVI